MTYTKKLSFEEALSLARQGYGVRVADDSLSVFEVAGFSCSGEWLEAEEYHRDSDGSRYHLTVTWGHGDPDLLCSVDDFED